MTAIDTLEMVEVSDLLALPPLLPALGDNTCLSVVEKSDKKVVFRVEFLGVLIGTWSATASKGKVKWSFNA